MKNDVSMITGGSNVEFFMDLGNKPNGNIFYTSDKSDLEISFPMRMHVCKDSWLVQLDEFPTPTEMFKSHPYLSGLNEPVLDHFERLAENLCKEYNLGKSSKILDIGANDGSLLSYFRSR